MSINVRIMYQLFGMNVYVLFIIDRESDIENGDNSYGYYGKSWCLIHLIQFKENIEHHTCSKSYFYCFFCKLRAIELHLTYKCMKFYKVSMLMANV